jgi:photosystem II stability/assembly factor-like uncharacterized protein
MLYKKKLCILILATLVFAVFGCRGGVEEEVESGKKYKMVTEKGLLSVSTPDKDNIWMVGYNGTILHSADGGKTWQQQISPLEIDLFDVFFTDDKNGWIVAKYGNAFHTTDGGETWEKVETGTRERLFSVYFTDDTFGWAVGSKGIIIHTADGGKTWQRQHYERIDDPFGEESGDDVDMEIYSLIHGKDGEKLTERKTLKHDDSTLNEVIFTDRNRGWIAGEFGLILHTSDGGKTWVQQECKELIPVVSEEEWEIQAPTLFSIYFETPSRGFASGLDSSILITEDGGEHWKNFGTQTDLALYTITVNGENGCAVGSKGAYYFSRDGGKTWSLDEKSMNTNFWMRDVSFSDPLNGWVVGSMGTIIHTIDGGINWITVSGITIN